MLEPKKRLALFEAFGIELEYMIVDNKTLRALPIADQLLAMLNQDTACRQVEIGCIAWSNELVKHVIELKANGPSTNLSTLHQSSQSAIRQVNRILDEHFQAKLLPTSMHPLFIPEQETILWQDEDAEIYQSYHRIFNCQGHGWSNLQSVHINLPFGNDAEFRQLHQAIRLILPLLPAIAASSPIVQGQLGPSLDMRLIMYSQNQRRIPEIIGAMIPEPIESPQQYYQQILKPMYAAIKDSDPKGILQHEWLNSRAAIPKFEKGCIEIRILDISECLSRDFAVIHTCISLIYWLCTERKEALLSSESLSAEALKAILQQVLEQGLATKIQNKDFLDVLQLQRPQTVRQIWQNLLKRPSIMSKIPAPYLSPLQLILERGSLADRIRHSLGPKPTPSDIIAVYQQLSDCLEFDQLYDPK